MLEEGPGEAVLRERACGAFSVCQKMLSRRSTVDPQQSKGRDLPAAAFVSVRNRARSVAEFLDDALHLASGKQEGRIDRNL